MKQLLIDIITYLRAEFPEIATIAEWNNQYDEINEGEQYGFMLPACFIEFVNETQRIQLGNGATLYDPLQVKFHLITEEYNSDVFTNYNNLDMNLSYRDLLLKIYNKFYLKEFDGAVAMVNTGEENDTQHSNIYHFISTFVTNYVDFNQSRPVNSQDSSPTYTIIKDIQ
jgi:hypothetical protein